MTWKRIEGSGVDPQVEEGLGARIADPLWLLARQWQVGEFRGEDAASPVLVEADLMVVPVTKYWTEDDKGDRRVVERGAEGIPLETLAEREPIDGGPADTRLRLESGAALLRQCRARGLPQYFEQTLIDGYPMVPSDDGLDPVGHARMRLLAKRSLDGAAFAGALHAAGGDPTALPEVAALPASAQPKAVNAINDWAVQEAAMFRQVSEDGENAWSARRLEYSFGVSAELPGGTVELIAPEYPGGQLDWQHFDVRLAPAPVDSGTPPPQPGRTRLRVLATPLQYAGMPAPRFWEIEDTDTYFGDLAGGPDDLARSVIAAYGAVAGDDWFVVPCRIDGGSVAKVVGLRVLDDFGLRTAIRATAAEDAEAMTERVWKWFEHSGDPSPEQGTAPLLFLPPVVGTVEQGRPLEAVEFRRDEMANLAWAIEGLVESSAGRAVDRDAGAPPIEPPELEEGDWGFLMATDVPDHWVPLVPIRTDTEDPEVVLRRGRVATAATDANRARGRILEPEGPFILNEEELPTGGLRVTRRYQLARSPDGDVHLWVGRRKSPSGGPMRRTPLTFDDLRGWET